MDFLNGNIGSAFQMGPDPHVDNAAQMEAEYLDAYGGDYALMDPTSYGSMEQTSYEPMGQTLYGSMEQTSYGGPTVQASYDELTGQTSYDDPIGQTSYDDPIGQTSYGDPTAQTSYDGPAEESSHIPMDETSNGSDEPDMDSPGPGLTLQGFTVVESRRKPRIPKRRGPKPDTKPATTRRQELNRQAQRTHRQRKEHYINNLEREIHRLKEIYAEACQERDACKDENQKLKDLLTAKGIPMPEGISNTQPTRQMQPRQQENQEQETQQQETQQETQSVARASVVGNAETVQDDVTPRSAASARNNKGPSPSGPSTAIAEPPPSQDMDYDQIGIEFILALEEPCMDHTQMLSARTEATDERISGHALMATCPPASHLQEEPDVQYPHKVPEMNPADLRRLLDLSTRLPLKDEVTPVMAWSRIMQDDRVGLLTRYDFMAVKDELQSKIHCYGFGAVVEEFEVRDAIEAVLAPRKDNYLSTQAPPRRHRRVAKALPAVAVSG